MAGLIIIQKTNDNRIISKFENVSVGMLTSTIICVQEVFVDALLVTNGRSNFSPSSPKWKFATAADQCQVLPHQRRAPFDQNQYLEIFKFLWFSENWIRCILGFSISSSSEVVNAVTVMAALQGESDDPSTLNNVKGGSSVLPWVATHGKTNT